MSRSRSVYVRGGLGVALLAALWAPGAASAADPVLCDSSPATIVGTDGPDELVGLPGVDVIAGLGGDDHITGDLKDDVVCGGEGDDTIVSPASVRAFGGPGNDHLEAAGSRGSFRSPTVMYGDDGDDVVVSSDIGADLYGGDGDDTLTGGDDYQTMHPGQGVDSVDGGDGGDDNDTVVMEPESPVVINLTRGFAKGQGRDTLIEVESATGTPYGDRIIGDDSRNRLDAAGDDVVVAGAEHVGGSAMGGAAHEQGRGTPITSAAVATGARPAPDGVDFIDGRGGGDTIDAFGGTVLAGKGDDRLYVRLCCGGTPTDDHIDGGAGYDVIDFVVPGGPVVLDLAAGTATGAYGNDVILGLEAANGTYYDDTFLGNDADNTFQDGGGGDDLFDGRGGNDTLKGMSGDDSLFGGPGDDLLDGGKDVNTLDGGSGVDTCTRGTTTNCEK